MSDQNDFEQALKDPASRFANPGEVLDDDAFSREQKIEILKRWDSDARQLMAASDENMPGGEPPQLQAIQDALRQLGADPHALSKDTGAKFR